MSDLYPEIFRLSNGIRVVFEKKLSLVAHMGVMVLAGSRFEKDNEIGLAHFVEHSLFKGTRKRKALDIFTDLDCVGGELNAYTNKEELCLHASFRRIHFGIASELLGDITKNATFPSEEIEKEKAVIRDEIISYLDSPSERIYDEFDDYLFKDHPLGNNILGTKESIESFQQELLVAYRDRLFIAENMVIAVVGNFDKNELVDQLETDFKDIRSSGRKMELVKPSTDVQFSVKKKGGVYQTHTIIGGFAPSYNDESRREMTLMTNYLGGPALNSRLALSVREKYGYAYNIEANYSSFSDCGFWSIYAGTDEKYTTAMTDLIYSELDDLRKNGISSKELEQAKEQLKGHIALSLDSNLDLMFSLAKSLLIYDKIDGLNEINSQIDSIEEDQLLELARNVFKESSISQLIYSL